MKSVQAGFAGKAKAQHLSLGQSYQPSAERKHTKVRTLQHVAPLRSGLQELERTHEGTSRTAERASPRPKERPAEQSQQTTEKFNWLKTWYPIAIVRDLPTDRPTAARLLGNAIVLWKDGDNQWRAFKDLCPHRLVPLSEGRVENGNLMCSYHGWEFSGSGKLESMPQADDKAGFETAKRSQRSCCTVHPCKEVDGLLWVYGSSEPGAEEEASTIGLEHLRLPTLDHAISIPWFVRDLPYGVDTLLENVLDPSHVPYSHHGVQGDRFKVTKTQMKPAEKIDKDGFNVTVCQPEDTPAEKKLSGFPHPMCFTPPSLVRYLWASGNILAFHAVPTDPGRSRIFFRAAFKAPPLKGLAALVLKLKFSKWGLWSDHFTRNKLLDGDGVFLTHQSLLTMAKGSNKGDFDASQTYYMPASPDMAVNSLRKWFARYAEALPWGPGALDPKPLATAPRSELLNRFEQHTRHCASCSKAHETFTKLRWVGAAVAVLSACWAAFSLGSGFRLGKLLGPVLLTALSAAVGWKSQDFKQQLEFEDYRHPDK